MSQSVHSAVTTFQGMEILPGHFVKVGSVTTDGKLDTVQLVVQDPSNPEGYRFNFWLSPEQYKTGEYTETIKDLMRRGIGGDLMCERCQGKGEITFDLLGHTTLVRCSCGSSLPEITSSQLVSLLQLCEADTERLLGHFAAQRLGNWRRHTDSQNDLVEYIQKLIWGENCRNGRKLDQQGGLSLERIVLDHIPRLFEEPDRQQAMRTLGIPK